MKQKLLILLTALMSFWGVQIIHAQTLQDKVIQNVRAEVKNDSLFISFDLDKLQKIESLWVEIRSADGKKIANNPLDNKIWNKVASSQNSKVIWAYALDNVDLAGQDILIDVKANVTLPEMIAPAIVTATPKNEYKKRAKTVETAKYPLFRLGLELLAEPSLFSESIATGTGAFSMTGEYIMKPNLSILSGVGLMIFDTYTNEWDTPESSTSTYINLIVPLTVEYKFNTGKWFRLFVGGGINNRIVINESDPYLNIEQGLNRYILGIKAEAGFEIKNVRFGAAFGRDLTSYSVFDEKHTYLSTTLGWRFGGSKAYIK